MAYSSLKNHSFIIIIIMCIISRIQSQVIKLIAEEEKLKDLKKEVESLEAQSQINEMVIYILVGIILFFLLIIIGISIYEIINLCRHKNEDLLKQTLLIGNLQKNGNLKNENNMIYSGASSKEDKKTLNSFHSSNYSESFKSKDEKFKDEKLVRKEDLDNNDIQKTKSNEYNDLDRNNSGYEAPIVQNEVNEEDLMTNEGNDNKKNKNKFKDNPY